MRFGLIIIMVRLAHYMSQIKKSPRPITHRFIEAAQEMQYRYTEDFNTGDNEGAGLYQVTQFHNIN